MARFSGHRCDRTECDVTAENNDTDKRRAPEGWIIVDTQVGTPFEFCGSRCVSKWATERARMDREVEGIGRTISDEGKQKILEGTKRRWHNNGSHDNNPDPDCPLCQEATAPA